MKKKVFLTGFRGAGKTTLAVLLGKRLNFEVIEMDKLIVERTKKTISELTNRGKDWKRFREEETLLLKEILKKDKIVVDTGGGLFVNDVEYKKGITFGEYNFNLVKDLPEKLIIFLKVKEEILIKRLTSEEFLNYNKKFRPSLSGDEKIDLKKEMEIYKKRLPLYEKRADYILENNFLAKKEALEKILRLICNC